MKTQAHLQEAFLNLFSSKLRSILALLGILVGTASVVAMVSAGQLATNEALKQFKTLGTDLLSISLSERENREKSDGTQRNLTLTQANNIISADKNIFDAAPYSQIYYPIQFNSHELSGSVIGVTDSFSRIVHVDMERGRFISSLDGYSFYCVIGHTLYDNMKKFSFSDPLGKQIQVGNNIVTIIGVAKPWPENSFVYANINNAVMVPASASMLMSRYAVLNNIILQLAPNANIDEVESHIQNYILQRVPNKKIFFRSAKELISSMTKQNEILTVFLGLIGGISLIVGGIGVMNIMLVSVVERRREIGIRLAVGAKRSDIRSLFLIEAVMLSLLGGALGVLIGMTIAYVIAWFWHWSFTLFLLPPMIGFIVSTATGIFFGFYPAYQASQLDPIDALRSE